MTIKEIQEEIVDEFSMFDDWMQRYEYIIELGKNLPLIKEELKTDENIIKGCQSKVWLQGEQQGGKVVFTADSDAILTKGIIAILIRCWFMIIMMNFVKRNGVDTINVFVAFWETYYIYTIVDFLAS